ncbi:MAG: hypothetical protein HQL23_02825 [Candidatus Omnitrophica bacterium]|nr:hypothetical protein [Candidatus Omnitrophota bacterium]
MLTRQERLALLGLVVVIFVGTCLSALSRKYPVVKNALLFVETTETGRDKGQKSTKGQP